MHPDTGIQGEPWSSQEETGFHRNSQEENWLPQESETWDSTAEALLQPPSNQSHNGLPTIHEQPPSGKFAQNGAVLSEIEESPDEYDQSWHNSDANSAQSQTVTATAPSFRGSPTVPPLQSNFVLEEAMKAVKSQGTSTASEAARKMEKAKAVQFREPDITPQVERSNPQVAARQGSSSASAAAFAAESSRKQTHAPTSGQKASNSKTIPWTYPKPGTRNLAPMPIDPSWIATGGNEWSNKHRNGFQNPNWSPGDEYLRTQHLSQPQFQQQAQFQQHPQHTQQARQSQHAQRPQAHQRHHSYPIQSQTHQSQSIRPLYKGQAKQRQDWQDWGKGQVDELTETESDGETATGWDTSDPHEGDQWGQSQVRGKKQNATGGEWGQGVAYGRVQNGLGAGNQNEWGQNAGESWGQHAGGGLSQGAWDQSAEEWGGRGTGDTLGQSAGGWAQEPTNLKKDDRKRKSHPKKGGDEWGQGGDTWGQGHEMTGQKRQKGQKGQGNTWGETNDAWGQESTQRQTQDAWGQDTNHQGSQGGDAWGQGVSIRGQNTNHQGGQGGDAWGQGVSIRGQNTNHQGGQGGDAWGQGVSTRGQDTNHQGSQGGDAWGQGASIRGQNTNHQGGQGGDAWGQGVSTRGQDTNHQGGQGGDAWGQGVSTRGQDTNHQGGQGGDAWGQGVSTWGQDTDNRKTAGEWAGGTSSNAAWGDEVQRLPKVTSTVPPEAVGSRNVLSPQQRSQILSNLLNQPQTQNVKIVQSAMKHGAQKKKTEHEQWGAWEAHDHGWGSEDEDDVDDVRRVRFSPKASELWGESPRSIPSKTLARAQQGITTIPINDPNTVRFLESKGAAFEYVTNAFFGNSRFARERIHWLFPSDKDPRVAAMLAWVQKLSYNLGTFGVRMSTFVLLLTPLTVANLS